MSEKKILTNKIILAGLILFSLPIFVSADSLGDKIDFFVDSNYDFFEREEISATLQVTGSNFYFYVDENWFRPLGYQEKQRIKKDLSDLGSEFSSKIYPLLTSTFGSEWKPGIDGDKKTTVLFHPMNKDAGGYFNNGDEYLKLQNPRSNEREMIYLNANYITSPLAKSFLAHEFTHLITFNQKDKTYGVSEETWLNEARAEYAPTLIGHDADYGNSNLERRVEDFLYRTYDSLTEWLNNKEDYGVANLFIQYLVDHYGTEVLVDSLQSNKIGIASLNYALEKNGFEKDFSQIFTDWTIAVLINDCQVSENYCYLNENLKTLRITPFINYLPLIGESTLSVTNKTKDWSGNWHKFIGGKDALKIEFIGDPEAEFEVPYLIEDLEGNISISFLQLSKKQKGTAYVPGFGSKNKSITIIPSSQTKIGGFDDRQESYEFSFVVSTVERTPEQEQELIEKLLSQIEFLKTEIAKVQAQIDAILGRKTISCRKFENNLYYGMMGNPEVSRLQEFLNSQGPEIYPERLVTGYFGPLTKTAVIRFQEKYAEEILKPLGLEKGTGFFGSATRTKINQLLGY